ALSRLGTVAAFLAVGTALSFLAFKFSRDLDNQRVSSMLDLRVEWRAQDFERKIAIAANDIESMAHHLATQGDVDATNFTRFAELAHSNADPVRALIWAPLVAADDPPGFLTRAHQAGSSIPDITEVMPDGRF